MCFKPKEKMCSTGFQLFTIYKTTEQKEIKVFIYIYIVTCAQTVVAGKENNN